MPKVRMEAAGVVQLCPHFGPNGRVHEEWHSRDGIMGVCQMTPSHLDNSVKMLLKSMEFIAAHYHSNSYKGGGGDYDPDYQMTEMKLEMLCRERTRRTMVAKGWASDMQALGRPKTELIRGHCYDISCSQGGGCQGNCLVEVLA